jgi:methylmalonyl-CoA mutase N-terminal domain/subunit
VAFALANRIAYIDATLERGLKFEEFAYRMPLAFAAEMDFFENVCKMRAIRKMFAKLAVNRYGQDPKTVKCPPCNYNFAGSPMTKEQPILNVIRNTGMAISAALAGVNGMEVTTYGEVEGIPPFEGWVVNRGIENVVAQETGVTFVADPLAGSYYVEWLTDQIETEATKMLDTILELGGSVEAIKKGWFKNEVEEAAHRRQKEIEERTRIKVGVNAFQEMNEPEIELPKLKQPSINKKTFYLETQEKTLTEIEEYKKKRDFDLLNRKLQDLFGKVRAEGNVIREMIEAYRAKATIGETMGTIREAMGYSYDVFDSVQRPSYLSDYQ